MPSTPPGREAGYSVVSITLVRNFRQAAGKIGLVARYWARYRVERTVAYLMAQLT